MIAAVVPAAGQSVRMGQPKLLMNFDGQTLIQRVVSALHDAGVDRIIVVPPVDWPEAAEIAAEAAASGAEVVIPETQPAEMRDSVELALAVLDADPRPSHVLLTPGDVPGITPGLVARLLEIASAEPDRIVLPSHDGHHGHPIVLPWSIAIQVRDLPDDAGVNRLIDAHRDRVREIPAAEAAEIDDVDTPEDVERYATRAGAGAFTVKVRLFAIARERAGRDEVEVNLTGPATVSDLRAALENTIPALDGLIRGAMISVDEDYATDDTAITPASRLALIPPVSGGASERADSTWFQGLDLR